MQVTYCEFSLASSFSIKLLESVKEMFHKHTTGIGQRYYEHTSNLQFSVTASVYWSNEANWMTAKTRAKHSFCSVGWCCRALPQTQNHNFRFPKVRLATLVFHHNSQTGIFSQPPRHWNNPMCLMTTYVTIIEHFLQILIELFHWKVFWKMFWMNTYAGKYSVFETP